MTTIVEKLAGLSEQIKFEKFPPEVVEKIKMVVLDSLGCAVGGYTGEPSKIMRSIVRRIGGTPEATVIGTGERTSALHATWANGTMIRYLDYNDGCMSRDPGHPSGSVATVLAMAEREGKNGKDMMCALALSYEIQLRLMDHCGEPSLWLRGWDHATIVPYAAAAAASRLLGLPTAKMAHAMAIAGSQSNALSEIRRGVISMIKGTTEAKAGGDGILAALMASEGMTGPMLVFEGDYGYINVVAGWADLDRLVAPIKDYYKVMRSTIKYYPVEMQTQAPVQAALELRAEHRIDAKDIERVVVGLYDFAFKKPSWDKSKLVPTTRESADHSFNYCVAAALLDGEMTAAQFTEKRIMKPDVRDLMGRTELVVDPELEGIFPKTYPGSVTIYLKGGRNVKKTVMDPIGHPNNPMSRGQVEDKFRRQCEPYMTRQQIDRVIETCWSLEKLQNIGDLVRMMSI